MDQLSKRPQRLGIAAIVIILALITLSGVIGWWSHSQLAGVTMIPLLTSLTFAAAAVWRSLLVRRVGEERMEHERLRRQYARNDLFDETDTAEQLAQAALRSFDRMVTPALTIGSALFQALLIWVLWQRASAGEAVNVERDALGTAGLALFMTVFCLLGGSYFNGLSREDGNRRLRPIAGWLFLTASFYLGTVVVMLAERSEHVGWDQMGARIALGLTAVFAFELISNCVMELYRPRGANDNPRPLYESRILAVLTEPGGLAGNVAHALDYQFGFEVSETWFYRFLERSVLPFFILTVAAFYFLDCFYKVDTGETALVERFGKPSTEEPVGPGIHVKLPRPFHRVLKFQTSKIQKLNIGFAVGHGDEGEGGGDHHDEPPMDPEAEERKGDADGKIIVWNKTHFEEETQFLVASGEQGKESNSAGLVPVNIVTTSVPLHYTIKSDGEGLRNYAYSYEDAREALRQVATGEVVRFLASRDLVQLLGANRQAAQVELQNRIKAAVAAHEPPLGVDIRFAGIMGIHPTAEVGEAFQQLAAADEERQTKILKAEEYAVKLRNRSEGEAARITLGAEAYRLRKSRVASAEAYRFEKQLTGWQAAPSVYKERLFLDMMEENARARRSYIIATENAKEIITIDLKEELRTDILNDLDLNRPDN